MVDDAEQIRRTMAEFSRALDERRFEDWSRTFTTDGVFDSRARRCTGRPAILARILETELALDPTLRRKHTVHNVLIDVHGDQADASCDLMQFDQVPGGNYDLVAGRYVDRLARQPDGRWLFTYRHVSSWDNSPPSGPGSVPLVGRDTGTTSNEEGIRQTLARYCRFLDERQFEAWSQVFTEDATFETDTPHHVSQGRAAIHHEILAGKLALTPGLRRQHTNHNIVITVTGDEASVVSDFIQLDRIDGELLSMRVGAYRDRMVRVDGRWQIAARAVSTWPMQPLA